jgi:hypothetical protein
MKIKIYKKIFSLKWYFFKEIELECKGEGTEQNPIIIEPTLDLPQDFDVRNNHLYINIINCKCHYISINNCKNITIEDCTFDSLIIDKVKILKLQIT